METIDRQARERAEGWVSDLATKVDEAEAILATLSGFVEEGTLAFAAVGRAGVKAGEMREQIPAIRQAIRDRDPSYSSVA